MEFPLEQHLSNPVNTSLDHPEILQQQKKKIKNSHCCIQELGFLFFCCCCLGGGGECNADNSILWALLFVTMAPHRRQHQAEQGYREAQRPPPRSSLCRCVVLTHISQAAAARSHGRDNFPSLTNGAKNVPYLHLFPEFLPACTHYFALFFPLFVYICKFI